MATFGQIPSNVPFSKMHIVADIAARDALTGLTHGDRAMVTGLGQFGLEFFYDGTSWVLVSGQLLSDETLGAEGGFSAVTVPAEGTDLVLVTDLRTSTAGTEPAGRGIRFNGDTGTNYRRFVRGFKGDSTNLNVSPGSAEDKLFCLFATQASSFSGVYAHSEAVITLYADSAKRRTIKYESEAYTNTAVSSADNWILRGEGVWVNTTDAINSVSLIDSNYIAGSRVRTYLR